MIELASVLFILLFFVFPLSAFAASLGLFTTCSLYKKYESFRTQSAEGKKSMIPGTVLFLINFICSIFLGAARAFAVYYFIFANFYLLTFNFLFCSAISLRWFDFTHNLYRLLIFKLKPQETITTSYFAVCQGFRESDGFGLSPVYTDEGHWHWKITEWSLKGCFARKPSPIPPV